MKFHQQAVTFFIDFSLVLLLADSDKASCHAVRKSMERPCKEVSSRAKGQRRSKSKSVSKFVRKCYSKWNPEMTKDLGTTFIKALQSTDCVGDKFLVYCVSGEMGVARVGWR